MVLDNKRLASVRFKRRLYQPKDRPQHQPTKKNDIGVSNDLSQ